ncbi:hypothetical protein L195_g021044, partial [Trifolium pratense]
VVTIEETKELSDIKIEDLLEEHHGQASWKQFNGSRRQGKCGHSKARWQECKSREGTICVWDEMQFDECRLKEKAMAQEVAQEVWTFEFQKLMSAKFKRHGVRHAKDCGSSRYLHSLLKDCGSSRYLHSLLNRQAVPDQPSRIAYL